MPLAFGDIRSPLLCYLQRLLRIDWETGGAKHSTLDVLWRSKKATDIRCRLPYMFRCNAIALDRIRVSQSRAIDPSWAQSSLGPSRFYRLWHLPPSLVSLPLYLKTPLCGGTP